jgi:hypothetical protein
VFVGYGWRVPSGCGSSRAALPSSAAYRARSRSVLGIGDSQQRPAGPRAQGASWPLPSAPNPQKPKKNVVRRVRCSISARECRSIPPPPGRVFWMCYVLCMCLVLSVDITASSQQPAASSQQPGRGRALGPQKQKPEARLTTGNTGSLYPLRAAATKSASRSLRTYTSILNSILLSASHYSLLQRATRTSSTRTTSAGGQPPGAS